MDDLGKLRELRVGGAASLATGELVSLDARAVQPVRANCRSWSE
jgi:hypothetical protein